MSRFTPLYLLRSARCLATPVAGSFVLLGLFASTSQPVHADAPPSAHPFDIPSKKPKAQVFFDEDGKPCKVSLLPIPKRSSSASRLQGRKNDKREGG